ncbi:MAG: VOC family protein [Pseudomonadales bacterium]
MLPQFPGVFQYAYYVEDLEQAALSFASVLGAGPFFLARHHRTDQFSYRGQSVEADVSYAFGYAGEAQIQLIEQHDETPSIYRDMYPEGCFGLHHVAKLVPDYEAAKASLYAQGFEMACELFADGVWAGYFDTRSQLHCFTEIHSTTDRILTTFSRWKVAHQAFSPGIDDAIVEHVSGS